MNWNWVSPSQHSSSYLSLSVSSLCVACKKFHILYLNVCNQNKSAKHFFYFALFRPDFQVRFSSIFPKKSLTSFSHPSFLLHHFRYMNKVKNSGKNSEKKWKKAKKVKKYTWISLHFVSLRSKKYSSEAKRKIWSENKRKEAKKEKWNFIEK